MATIPDSTTPDSTIPDSTIPDSTIPDNRIPDSRIPETGSETHTNGSAAVSHTSYDRDLLREQLTRFCNPLDLLLPERRATRRDAEPGIPLVTAAHSGDGHAHAEADEGDAEARHLDVVAELGRAARVLLDARPPAEAIGEHRALHVHALRLTPYVSE